MRVFFAILFFTLSTGLFAQNGIDVRNFISPVNGFNYDTNATANITVRIRNDGPITLSAQDSIYFSITIATNDTTLFLSAQNQVFNTLSPNSVADYVLIPNYSFSKDDNYVICVTANGTKAYPNNTTKNPRHCVSFVVGIDEKDVKIKSAYYANNQLSLSIAKGIFGNVEIYDLTGRIMQSKRLDGSGKYQIPLYNPAKGFYFARLISRSGQSSTIKFVVN